MKIGIFFIHLVTLNIDAVNTLFVEKLGWSE